MRERKRVGLVYPAKMASNEKRPRSTKTQRKRKKEKEREKKESGKSVANVLIEAVLTEKGESGEEAKENSYGATGERE